MADRTAPLISVVLPTYQGDNLAFLRQAVESVLRQTHSHLELIVVQDGPIPVETRQFLEERTAADRRVRTAAFDRNRGQSAARNRGIGEARGDYVALLDADDVAHPQRLAVQLRYLRHTGADLVGSCYRVLGPDGQVEALKRLPTEPESVRRLACVLNPIANSAVFTRTELLKSRPFAEEMRSHSGAFPGEDYALWVTLLREGWTLANLPEYLVDFRAGPQFYERRRGWTPFWTDFTTKLRALALWPAYARPALAPLPLLSSLPRLLPARLLRPLYALRNRMRFRD
jgi:glycosyltransferase involved in cell wall biosynthesis